MMAIHCVAAERSVLMKNRGKKFTGKISTFRHSKSSGLMRVKLPGVVGPVDAKNKDTNIL